MRCRRRSTRKATLPITMKRTITSGMTARLASAFSWFGETLKLKEESVASLPAAEADVPEAPPA